jgi:hypothetical protein
MEKAVVFGPMLIFFIFFTIMVIAFVSLVVKLIFKAKNEEWLGEIVDKKVTEVEDEDSSIPRDYYYLVVRLDSGKERKVALSRERWESFSVGDKILKPKGKLYPEKL